MRDTLKILGLGMLLALVTAAVGWHGFSDWNGESGGHRWAFVGLTFFGPLFLTESWTLAAMIHWVICTLCVWPVFTLVRFRRGDSPGHVRRSE